MGLHGLHGLAMVSRIVRDSHDTGVIIPPSPGAVGLWEASEELPGRPPRSPGAAHAESIARILLGYQGIARILLVDPIKPLVNLDKNTSLVGITLLHKHVHSQGERYGWDHRP